MRIKRGDIMKKPIVDEFEKALSEVLEVEPDEWDLKMLAEIDADKDDGAVPLEKVREYREYSGKVSLRIPKTLHRDLSMAAKNEGISLNQFILYKLAK